MSPNPRIGEVQAELLRLLDDQIRDTQQYKIDLAAARALGADGDCYAILAKSYEQRNETRGRRIRELNAALRG
jgi:hypothetical protein